MGGLGRDLLGEGASGMAIVDPAGLTDAEVGRVGEAIRDFYGVR